MLAGIRKCLFARQFFCSFFASRVVTDSNISLAWRFVGDPYFCAVNTASLYVSWFSSSAFVYVRTAVLNVPLFTNSLSSHYTVQTLSLIGCQPLVFRSVSPVTFMDVTSVIIAYCRKRGYRLSAAGVLEIFSFLGFCAVMLGYRPSRNVGRQLRPARVKTQKLVDVIAVCY